MRRRAAIVLTCVVAFGACGKSGTSVSSLGSQRRRLVVNGQPTSLCLTLATTVAQQGAGLSNRQALPPNEGMAFLFGGTAPRAFWMKDTHFPLTILWLAGDGQIRGSNLMAPDTTLLHESPGPIATAIELNPQEWAPLAASARTVTLGPVCPGTLTAGRPGTKPAQF
ncbi:MAG: DUF192 domain-containing protein [Acidimicrobiia bacterium]|nr:DUF192 domain-containing protein [Acidimicrobiia bacterium]